MSHRYTDFWFCTSFFFLMHPGPGYPQHRENGQKESLSGKTQGICFAQVVNSLILKVKDIPMFATKISKFCLKLDKSAKSVLCM